MEKTTLYFRQGSSDKVYQASIAPQGTGYVVQIAYGQRGSTLATGTKTPTPVSHDEARAIFRRVITQKIAKGYRAGEDTSSYIAGSAPENTGIHCQLLTPVEENRIGPLIEGTAFWAQEKLDGRRLLIKRENGVVTGINKLGFPVGIPAPMAREAMALTEDFIIDGEAIGDVLHVFDLLSIGGEDVRDSGYAERSRLLYGLVATAGLPHIRRVEYALLSLQKRTLLERLRHEGKEGIVFKHLNAPYVAGRSNTQFKFKFCASASCLVGKVNSKRSVRLELLDGDRLVSVGNVTIPPNQEIPPLGSVIECRYLYAFRGGSLFQPVYLGQRDDILTRECVIGQLKFKAELEPQAA